MTTLSMNELSEIRGQTVVDASGDKIGKVDEIYLDQQSGQPEWLAVSTGLFGANVSFVPLERAQREGDSVKVPWDKDKVKDAPNVEPDGELSPQQEQQLYEHY